MPQIGKTLTYWRVMNQALKRWTREEVKEVFNSPILDLVYRASNVTREFHDSLKINGCTLLSIKTGRCPEDCKYCSQSSRYQTSIEPEKLLPLDVVLKNAKEAKEAGSYRFCLSAAWRKMPQGEEFERVLEMIRGVKALDMEVCSTMGMVTAEQAVELEKAGLSSYNHNLDTSERFYPEIISTRTWQDRLDTIANLQNANIPVCSGGILGLGETNEDRIDLILALSGLPKPLEVVTINTLVPIEGTPLEENEPVDFWDLLRVIATARIIMPQSRVSLAAGRKGLTDEQQALCILAGANGSFIGEKLLTTANPTSDTDKVFYETMGLNYNKGN